MNEMRSRSFRLERVTSVKLAKSKSWLHLSDAVSAETERVPGYEKLSELLRKDNSEGDADIISHKNNGSKKSRTLGLISKVFSFRKKNNAAATANKDDGIKEKLKTATEEENKKKKSSWLPSPKRRWS